MKILKSIWCFVVGILEAIGVVELERQGIDVRALEVPNDDSE